MIRTVCPEDAKAIAAIYNVYVIHTTITFDTEPVSAEAMRQFVADISTAYPFLIYEENGAVKGFCYAHLWKNKAAYRHTWETTIYLAPDVQGRGIGTQLMKRLAGESKTYGCKALIACITEGNTVSEALHLKLGFRKVSHFEKVGIKFGRSLDVADYELLL